MKLTKEERDRTAFEEWWMATSTDPDVNLDQLYNIEQQAGIVQWCKCAWQGRDSEVAALEAEITALKEPMPCGDPKACLEVRGTSEGLGAVETYCTACERRKLEVAAALNDVADLANRNGDSILARTIRARISSGDRSALDAYVQQKVDEQRASKDGAYKERDQLVCALSKLFPSSLERHPDQDTAWENDWRWIVFIDLPTGQATWHIHDSELSAFGHLPRFTGRKWDGHSTPEKYVRLSQIVHETVQERVDAALPDRNLVRSALYELMGYLGISYLPDDYVEAVYSRLAANRAKVGGPRA